MVYIINKTLFLSKDHDYSPSDDFVLLIGEGLLDQKAQIIENISLKMFLRAFHNHPRFKNIKLVTKCKNWMENGEILSFVDGRITIFASSLNRNHFLHSQLLLYWVN